MPSYHSYLSILCTSCDYTCTSLVYSLDEQREKNTSRCLRLPLTIAMRKRVEGRLKELDEKHEAEVDTQNK